MTKATSFEPTLQAEFRSKSDSLSSPKHLAKSAVVQYFVGAYLGTRHGLGYGYPTQKYAQGFDWIARVDNDKLTVTRTTSSLDRSSIDTQLRDLHLEQDRLIAKLDSLKVMAQEFEATINQAESRKTFVDEPELSYLNALTERYYLSLSEVLEWRRVPEEALVRVQHQMQELANRLRNSSVDITIDLGEYV